jgi:hypothetical protein
MRRASNIVSTVRGVVIGENMVGTITGAAPPAAQK